MMEVRGNTALVVEPARIRLSLNSTLKVGMVKITLSFFNPPFKNPGSATDDPQEKYTCKATEDSFLSEK